MNSGWIADSKIWKEGEELVMNATSCDDLIEADWSINISVVEYLNKKYSSPSQQEEAINSVVCFILFYFVISQQ